MCACFILVRCLGRRICSRGPALFLGCQSPACGGACRPCWKSLSSWRQRSPPRQPHRFGGRRTPALAGGPAGEECQTPSASGLRCGSICREPKSNGVSAEVATVEKSATEARAVTVFAKMVSSPSLKDKIINFPSGSPPSITRHFSYRSTSSKRFDATR